MQWKVFSYYEHFSIVKVIIEEWQKKYIKWSCRQKSTTHGSWQWIKVK